MQLVYWFLDINFESHDFIKLFLMFLLIALNFSGI